MAKLVDALTNGQATNERWKLVGEQTLLPHRQVSQNQISLKIIFRLRPSSQHLHDDINFDIDVNTTTY